MNITLEKASVTDAKLLHDIQVESFLPLLEKYKDYHTNPANEPIAKVETRLNDPHSSFYKIHVNNEVVGAIRIIKKENAEWWISPMFILPNFQGKGIAQKVIFIVEQMVPRATSWNLATILEEKRNCYLYEKLGYEKTGEYKKINELTTLVYYKKYL